MSWDDRINTGEHHEAQMMDWLRAVGFTVEPFGQALLTRTMRHALRDCGSVPIRWLPDAIATRNGRVYLFDGKTGRTDTPNYDIECASVSACIDLERALRLDVYYVMHDRRVLTPDIALAYGVHGPRSRNGSGTPYLLIPKGYAIDLESWVEEGVLA